MTQIADLEAGLRATLRDLPGGASGDAGAVAERVIAGAARAQHRRRVRAVVAGLVAACAVSVVAVALGAGGRPAAVPAAPEGCEGMTVSSLGAGTSGRTERDFVVSLVNSATSGVCELPRGPAGIYLRVGQRPLDVIAVVPDADAPLRVEPGGELAVRAVWSNWCGGFVRAATFRITWATTADDAPLVDAVTEPFQPSPSCADHTEPSRVTVESITASEPGDYVGPTPSPPPAIPADPALLKAAGRWSAAMVQYVACLREKGAVVTVREQYTLSLAGPDSAAAEQACQRPKPAVAGGYDADELWAALHPGATHTPVPYPTNADGLTYGTEADVPAGLVHPEDLPDLVRVASTGGIGYVYSYELNGGPQAWVTNPQQAVDYMNDPEAQKPRTLTAYELDGITEVGTFTTG